MEVRARNAEDGLRTEDVAFGWGSGEAQEARVCARRVRRVRRMRRVRRRRREKTEDGGRGMRGKINGLTASLNVERWNMSKSI